MKKSMYHLGSNIRVSINVFNNEEDIEKLVSVIKRELI